MGNAEYMGTVFPRQSDNMKFFAVLALAAVAFAEPEADAKADPAVLYGAYGYGLPYASVYGGYRTYGAYPYTYGGAYYGKRSADAEPEAAADAEADPALLYGAYGYGLPYSSVYRSYGAYPYGYRTYGAYSYGYYGKRSADAEPEADAEADPALLYGAYGHGLPYSGVYRSYGAYPYGYRTYGAYPYAYYGKRSADAEPEADPALLYTPSNVVSPLTTAYTHVAAPLTTAYTVPQVAYTHSVAAPVVKTVVPQVATYPVPAVSTVHKAPAHGVAATYAGLVHSSHVGVCLNNVGVQVPC